MIWFWSPKHWLILFEMISPWKRGQWNAFTLRILITTFQIGRMTWKKVQVYNHIRLVIDCLNYAQINVLQFQKRLRVKFFKQPMTHFGTGSQSTIVQDFHSKKCRHRSLNNRCSSWSLQAWKAMIEPGKVIKKYRVDSMKIFYTMASWENYRISTTCS